MAQTKAADLFNPEVLGDILEGQLEKAIRFSPYAKVDDTLEGQPGDTITRLKYAYIGAAEDLEEGVPMDTEKLSITDSTVTIKEAGKAVKVTEKAIITNVDGTMNEAGRQILMSLGDKGDIDYLEALESTQLTAPRNPIGPSAILRGIDVFDDEDEEDYILFINNKDYTKLVESLFDVGGQTQENAIARAQVAELVGVSEIVKTKRLDEGEAYLQKPEAVEIVLKKRPNVEGDHDVLARTFVLAGNQYYVIHLYNDNGVVRVPFSDDSDNGETP